MFSKLSSSLLRVLLVCLTMGFASVAANATHLRGTSVSWVPTSTPGTVTFTVQYSQRASFGCNQPLPCIVGDTVNIPFATGDGKSTTLVGSIVSVNSSLDYFSAIATYTYTYASPGSYIAAYDVCCRVGSIVSGANLNLNMQTNVIPFGTVPSAVVSMPAILTVPLQNTVTYQVYASDSNNNTLTYRLATAEEMYALPAYNCAGEEPPGLSINSTTGLVTWDTTQITLAGCGFAAPKAGDLWAVQVMVEVGDGSNNVVTQTPLDMILEFISSTETPPTLTFSNPGPITVAAGTPISFTATGNDSAAGSLVTLGAAGLPIGATATNLNQSLTPPLVSAFNWTPTVGQAGSSYVITYTVTNDTYQEVTGSVTINVTAYSPVTALSFSTPPATPITAGGNAGSAVTVDELNSSSSIITTATDLITLTVTGPGGYLQTYTSTAVAGVATFNLATPALTTAGSYTYTASLTNVTSAIAYETVNAASPATFSGSGGATSSQSTVIGAAYVYPFNVLVKDVYGNPVPGATVNYSVPAGSVPSANLSLSSATTDSSGIGSVTGTADAYAGGFNVTAIVNGVAGSVTFPVINTKATPTASLSATPSTPITYGSSQTTLSSTVSYTTGTPTGSVTFYNGGTSLSQAETLSSGSGSYSLYLPAATYSLTSSYSGDNNYVGATSTPASPYTVNKASTTITASSAQTVAALSSSSTVGLTITGAYTGSGILAPGSAGNSTVTCTFYNSGATLIGSSTVTAAAGTTSSTAACPVPTAVTATAGSYTATASFNGDSNYLASALGTGGGSGNSLNFGFTVQPVTPSISWTSAIINYGVNLSSVLTATASFNGNPVAGGGSYTYTATQTGGTVTTASILPAGSYTLQVTFTPNNSNYNSVTSSISLTVNKIAPLIVLQSSMNPVLVTNSVTFTATVSSVVSTPTGTVNFFDGTTPIGSGTLNAGGVVTLTTSTLALGTHPITAVYSGDSNFLTVTNSPAVSELVQDFNLAISTSSGSVTTETVDPGSPATYLLVVSPVAPAATFPAIINLTATGLPPGATYTLTPSSLAAGSGTTNVTLVINTSATSAMNHSSPRHQRENLHFGRGLISLALAMLFLPFTRRMRRAGKRLARMMSLLLLLVAGMAAATGLNACGGTTTGFFGEAPKTYTISVTGTSGPLSHSTTVTLTIE